MDQQSVLAKCHLHAVLPLLEEIVDYDAEAKAIVADWDGTIQFSCPGGFGEYIEFKNGEATAHRGTLPMPTVALWFISPAEMNKLFTGQGFTVPIPWRGITKIKMLKGFTELTKRLEYYMKTEEADLPAEHKPFVTKLKLYAAGRALKEVGENDAHVMGFTSGLPNGVAELRIKDGPAVHITVRNGVLMPEIGPFKGKPNAVMEFGDVEIAAGVFDDKLDAMAAIGSGDILLEGAIPMIDNMNAILDRVSFYLA